jgi:sodium transport system permease protein
MSGLGNIFRKELARVFKDKKMLFTMFILPIIITGGIMFLVGQLVTNMMNDVEKHESIVYMANEPASFEQALEASGLDFNVKLISTDVEIDKVKDEILNGEADLLVEFPDEFVENIENYATGDTIPDVHVYSNSSEEYSTSAAAAFESLLESYRQGLVSERIGDMGKITVFTVNADNKEANIVDSKKANGKALGQMIPYFLTILLFAGAMAIGSDMVAGEKERGTMAALLVSPVSRTAIALGKVFALIVISGVSAIIYAGSFVIGGPMVLKDMMANDPSAAGALSGLSINFSIGQVLMLSVLLVALAFLYSTIIAAISAIAKTTKEAASYMMPAYMLVMISGLGTMFTIGEPGKMSYIIPFYNTSLVLQRIMTGEILVSQYLLTLAETLLLAVILMILIVKAFNSEKVMSK